MESTHFTVYCHLFSKQLSPQTSGWQFGAEINEYVHVCASSPEENFIRMTYLLRENLRKHQDMLGSIDQEYIHQRMQLSRSS